MQIFAFDTVPSTMGVAREILKKTCDDIYCVLAKSQENGIGTHARKWHSPAGNFYATYCFKNVSQDLLAKISLISGISVVQSLKDYAIDAALKWTNDIIIQDKKVGGILCEFYDNALCIGIGINFKVNPVTDDKTALFSSDKIDDALDIDYFEFAKILGLRLSNHLNLLKNNGFGNFIPLWRNYAAFYNRQIAVVLPDETIKIGIDKGINDDGCLLLATQSGIEYFYSARITKVF